MAKYHHILQTIEVSDWLFKEYLSVFAQNRYCYIYDDGSGWRTMFRWIDKEKLKKRFFPASELEIAKHISHEYPDAIPPPPLGKGAIGLRAYKETTYFDIDMDGNQDKYAMYQRMHEITHFLHHNDVGVYDVIVLERKESGNLSIVGRCEPIKTYEMARCMKTILSYALEDPEEVGKPGFVEIYPKRNKARRLPFASDQQIISSDSFTKRYPSAIYESEFTDAQRLTVSKSDDIQRFLSLSPIDLKAFAAALEELWGNHETSKAPMYTQPYKEHFKESIHSASAFTLRCNWLWEKGLSDYGTRHDAETDLILFFWMLSKRAMRSTTPSTSEEECYAEIEGWYKSGKTNGYSKEWEAYPDRVLRNLRNHIRSYYRWLNEHGCIPLGLEDAVNTSARLSYQDVYYIHQIALRDLRFGEWLFDLMLYAKQRKVFLSRLFLSKETLRTKLRNGDDKWTIYLQQCIDANLLEQVGNRCNFNTRFGTFRRPRVFRVNYEFEDTALLPKGVSYRKALTQIFSAKQIREMFPKTTAWRLNLQWNKEKIIYLRKGLGLTQQQFAYKLGVSKRAVIYWEKGKRAPSSEIKTKLEDLASEIE